jgi:protein phosphatase
MRAVQVSAAGATNAGPRPSNQDTHLVDVDLGLFVVADGMGGHNAGEVASRMAVDVVVDFIRSTQRGGDITWPFPMNPACSFDANRIDVALKLANHRVHDAGERDPEHAGMGTTIVVALVDGDHITIGHVGDSRAYVLRDGSLRQMTQDHTWLNAISNGREEMRNHPLRHVLTNGIGMGTDLSPTVLEERLAAGERWLICTDGVHGFVDRDALQRVISGSTASGAAEQVVQRALDAGTTDNATAVVLNVD